jgi:hypothetical protein
MRRVIAEHFQKQATDHGRNLVFVVAQVGYRADRLRQDQQAIGVIRLFTRLAVPQQGAHGVKPHHHAGQVIVDHRRVTQVGDQHESLGTLPGNQHLANFQGAGLETGADDDAIGVVSEALAQIL